MSVSKVEIELLKNIDALHLLQRLDADYILVGSEARMPCPFHNGNGKNLSINLDNKKLVCFSHHCEQQGYTFVDLVQKLSGMTSRSKATQYMAKMFGYSFDERACNLQDDFYQPSGWLPFKEATVQYLKNIKSLSPTQTLDMTMGEIAKYNAALLGSEDIKGELLQKKGITEEDILQYHIGYDAYREDVVIPVMTTKAQLHAVCRRTLNPEKEQKGEKYKFNGKKSECLYGLYDLKKQHFDLQHIILVEGIFDAIALQKMGYSAVALMTTNISNYQLKLLLNLSPSEIVLCLDNDSVKQDTNPGEIGTLNCINKMAGAGIDLDRIKVIELAGHQDPDEVPEVEFRKLFVERMNALDYFLKVQVR